MPVWLEVILVLMWLSGFIYAEVLICKMGWNEKRWMEPWGAVVIDLFSWLSVAVIGAVLIRQDSRRQQDELQLLH